MDIDRATVMINTQAKKLKHHSLSSLAKYRLGIVMTVDYKYIEG